VENRNFAKNIDNMSKSFFIAICILLCFVNSTKVMSGTFTSTDAQDEWTVRFDMKNTENE
jgi:hypothetical protein